MLGCCDVVDSALLQKMLALQSMQLPNLAKIPHLYHELFKQNVQLFLLKRCLSGDSGLGELLNTDKDIAKRAWAHPNWESLLRSDEGTNYASLIHLQQAYAKQYPVMSDDKVGLTDADLIRAHYRQSKAINLAALAVSAQSYNQLQDRTDQVQSLLNHLKDTPTEKGTMDMNARLLAEVTFTQIEMLRQQTIQNQLLATQAQSQVNGLSEQVRFNQWHP
jgi:hypothetical protein